MKSLPTNYGQELKDTINFYCLLILFINISLLVNIFYFTVIIISLYDYGIKENENETRLPRKPYDKDNNIR